jgi:hypothetical protein
MNKKTVFKGVINGKHFDDVKEYNKYLSKLIEAGETFSAETSTQTVAVDENKQCKCKCNDDKVNEFDNMMLPYFNDSEYYLDKIVTADNEANVNNIERMEFVLSNNLNLVKANLVNMTDNDLKMYTDKILDILNNVSRDKKFNNEAQEKISKKIEQTAERYEKQMAAAQAEHDIAMEKYDAEYEILESAEYVMDKMVDYYNKVLKLLHPAPMKVKDASSEHLCEEGTCTCNQPVKTEIKELKKEKVTDLASLFNKIFGIDINKL